MNTSAFAALTLFAIFGAAAGSPILSIQKPGVVKASVLDGPIALKIEIMSLVPPNLEDESSYYVKFELAHYPNESFEYDLPLTKAAAIGFGSNFYDLYHVEYEATFKGIRDTEPKGIIFY